MADKKVWDPSRLDELVSALKDGMKPDDMVAEFGLSKHHIGGIRKAFGCSGTGGRPTGPPSEMTMQIIRLHRSGLSNNKISKQLKCSESRVSYIVLGYRAGLVLAEEKKTDD